jgi:hypothetical protein
MKRKLFIGVAVLVALIACGLFVHHLLLSNEELASKPEWATIQIVEQQHRDKASQGMEFVSTAKYSLVGIPVNDRRKKVWIMLNPRYSPYYKQLPVGNFKISKEDLERVRASGSVSSTVANCLESHIE